MSGRRLDALDEIAFVDLAIAFFCAVLVIFVFADFQRNERPEPEVRESLQQDLPTQEITPPGWAAVNERGSFAVFHDGILTPLDVSALASGLADPSMAYSGEDGFTMTAQGGDVSPLSFIMRIGFLLPNVPASWSREPLVPSDLPECPVGLRSLVTVLATPSAGDLSILEGYLRDCGHRLRVEALPEPSAEGMTGFSLELSPRNYRGESIFR